MIWSNKCINEKAGFIKSDDGTLKPKEIGRYVYTLKELEDMKK